MSDGLLHPPAWCLCCPYWDAYPIEQIDPLFSFVGHCTEREAGDPTVSIYENCLVVHMKRREAGRA